MKKLSKQILHEISPGRHRIVIVSADQTVSGTWADITSLAELNGLLANAGASKQLPNGVFKVASMPQQVLS